MSWSIIVTVAAYALALAAGVTLSVRQARRNRRRIRCWADENGYAVLRLEYRRSGVVMVACLLAGLPSAVLLLFRLLLGAWGSAAGDGGRRSLLRDVRRLLLDLPPGAYVLAGLTVGLLLLLWILMGTWIVAIQDEQGGQRNGYVTFGHWLVDLPWGRMNVEWR